MEWKHAVAICAVVSSVNMVRLCPASIVVSGTDDIFAAGQIAVPNFVNGGGTLPQQIITSSGTQFQFSAIGSVSYSADPNTISSNPDGGLPALLNANVLSPSGAYSINLSGYHGPDAALVGVFLANTLPVAVPATLDFTATGLGSAFTQLSPGLGQLFFVGDGLTGTGTGGLQTFIAPPGATHLFLGLVDSDTGVGDLPGNYASNSGSYFVSVNTVPEPSSLALLGLGAAAMLRRRREAGQAV